MDAALVTLVRLRADRQCEYCRYPESESSLAFAVDHIIARQHRGPTVSENLALACGFCNLHKGPNIAGLDPESGELCRLFNPRTDRWRDHFQWDGVRILGLSPFGRTTIEVLAMNDGQQISMRQVLMRLGWVHRI